MSDTEKPDYTTLTVQLLSAYVANNSVPSNELAALIQSTRSALIEDTAPAEVETPEHTPAVSIRKSLSSREHVISLIDGRPYKTLKRHLAANGLTPDEYRERFGLPKSYPMVAPGYSEQRRAVAQKIGLGQRGTAAQAAAQASPPSNEAVTPATPPATEKPAGRKGRSKTETPAAPAKADAAPAKKGRAKKQPVEEQAVIAAEAAPKPARKLKAPKSSAEAAAPPAKTTPKAKPAASEAPKPARASKASRTKAKTAPDDNGVGTPEAAAPAKPARRKLGISTPKGKPAKSDQTSDATPAPAEG